MGKPRTSWSEAVHGMLAVLATSALLVLGAAAVVATSLGAAS